jgi:hypothetical protein
MKVNGNRTGIDAVRPVCQAYPHDFQRRHLRVTQCGKKQLEEATRQVQPRIPLRRRGAGTIFLGSRYGGRICGIFCASTTTTISFSFKEKIHMATNLYFNLERNHAHLG